MEYRCRLGTPGGEIIEGIYAAENEAHLRRELSFGAQLLMTDAYGALTVAEAALWQQLTPVASYVWALAVLGERFGVVEATGVLIGLAGVTYGTILGHKSAGAAKASARTVTDATEPVKPA